MGRRSESGRPRGDRAVTSPSAPDAEPAATPWAKRTFAALAHRNYRLFFVGMAISSVGGWARSAAQQSSSGTSRGLRVARLVVAACLLGSRCSTPGGALADRLDRRRGWALHWSRGSLSCTLTILIALGKVTPEAVLANAIGLGLAGGAEMPFRQSYLVELVGKGGLRNAVALNSFMFNLPLALGPAVAARSWRDVGRVGLRVRRRLLPRGVRGVRADPTVPRTPTRAPRRGRRVPRGRALRGGHRGPARSSCSSRSR